MEINFGLNVAELKLGKQVAVKWESARLINGHVILLGDSGSGKTYQLRKLISEMRESSRVPVRFHVFGVHGGEDISVPDTSTVMFSESTDFGFNPLEINPDRNFGGVRKRIQGFISAINRTSIKLGPKQEAVLRHILTDLYEANGFKLDDPESWICKNETSGTVSGKEGRIYLDVPFEEKERAKNAGAQWDSEVKAWYVKEDQYGGPLLRWSPKPFGKHFPTLLDAVRFSKQRLKAMFFGANQATMSSLEAFTKASRAYKAKQISVMKCGENAPDADKLAKALDMARDRAIETYTEYVNAVPSGRELDDLIKYDSVDVMKSVVNRLENLNATGIFRNTPPPFDPKASVWCYDIKALNEDEKKLFVTFRLEAIFANAIQRGVQDNIVEVINLDEAHLFTGDEPENILNKFVKEARKFGVAVILASQAPTHFPDDLISGVGTKILLGIDKFFWPMAIRKLGVNEEALKFIIPKKRMVVQMKVAGKLQSNCQWVDLG